LDSQGLEGGGGAFDVAVWVLLVWNRH
jgi:hypothetical protein